MGKLEKYSSYKDSGIEWLGKIPEHWNIEKLKSYCKAYGRIGFRGYTTSDLVNENEGAITISPSNIYEYSMIFEKCSFLSWEKYYESPEIQIEENDILIVKTGSTFGKVGMVKGLPEKATINPQLLVLKNIKIEKRFFYYILTSSIIQTQVNKQVIGSTIPTISENKILNFISLLPSKEEQIKIAFFLDEKTAQIDEVISQKQKLIELLKERKEIVINDAVTKGLDKNVEFVDRGVEWIGQIPKHWEIKKLKYIFKEINERSETGEEELLSLSKYQGVIPKSSLEERAGMAKTLVGYKKVYKNDLVINKMQAVNGLLAVSKIEGITSPDYAVYRTISDKYNIDYYGNLLSQSVYLSEFKKVVTGVMEGFIRLYTDDLYNVTVHVPPKNEQLQIVEYIENQTTKIDKAIELQQNYISKLKEYKASLIDSVVTGKVKV